MQSLHVIAAGVQFPADSALTAAFQMIEMFFILKDKGTLDADGSGQLSRVYLCIDAGKVPMVWVWTGPVVLLQSIESMEMMCVCVCKICIKYIICMQDG